MTDKENELLVRIGQALANIIGKDANGAFSYTEAREMWMSPSVYHDEGNRVVCYRPSMEFCDAVEELWYAREPEARWEAMRYEIVDGQFSVEFDYSDQLDPNKYADARQDRAVKARFGDKPIIYPRFEDEDWHELTEDDLSTE